MYNVIFNSGFIGFLIWLLLFCTSTAALAVALRCAWRLRRGRFVGQGFEIGVLPLLHSGRWQEGYEAAMQGKSVADRITSALLESANLKDGAGRQELATALLDREVRSVLREINSLSMCGNIAPMLGLLGTVTGMVDAFMGLGTAMGPEKASILAISISQALYTTAAGLLVAVPAIVLAVFFRNQLEKRVELVTDILEKVLSLIPENK